MFRVQISRRGSGPKPALLCRKCSFPVKVDSGVAVVEKINPTKGFIGYECGGCD